jgi:hypothetical protein
MIEEEKDLTPEQVGFNDKLFEKLKTICDELYPYFDTVQILCTKHEGNGIGTTQMNYGVGNWFARIGQAQDWLNRELTLSDEK